MSKKNHRQHSLPKRNNGLDVGNQQNDRNAGIIAILAVLGTVFLALAGFFWPLNHTVLISLLLISFIVYGIGLFIELLKYKWGKLYVWLCSGGLIVFGIVLCAGLALWNSRLEDEFFGVLVPANDSTPINAQGPTNSISLILGNTVDEVFWFPHTVLIYKGKPILTISKNSKGATISGEFFGDNGDIVAVLENNHFTINRLNYFTKERPDKSTLIVRDQKNIEILNVRFVNPRTIKLLGRFRMPYAADLVINEKEGFFSHTNYSVGCSVDYVFR
jgi:ribosomal protein L24